MSSPAARAAQIAHVLCMDIVEYSRGNTSAQGRLLEQLNAAVSAAPAFKIAQAANGVQPLPTGDGMVLLFVSDVIAPAQCAVEVYRALEGGRAVPVRMGIHSGLVQKQIDIAGRENVVGEGINTAERVMSFGSAGHILLSAQYAGFLQQFDDWAPSVHRLGQGIAKHNQKLEVYSLHGPDFGCTTTPAGIDASSTSGSEDDRQRASGARRRASSSRKVALLYKPSLQPDEDVLRTLETQLQANGYEVFLDNQQKINAAWARAIEEPIRRADAVIALVSPRSRQSEMLEFEIETAHDQQLRTGKPIILPVIIGEAEPLEGAIEAILRPLDQFMWAGPQDDRKLVAELLSAIAEPLKPRAEDVKLEPVGGAVPPDSPFYVRRASDQEFTDALEAGESLLLVKGARQIGKTSLLAQGAMRARERGWRQALTDFQKFNTGQMTAEDHFYKLLAATLARQLRFEYDFESGWDEIFGANLNMESFLRELLEASDAHLVWFMDEVDKLFVAPFASDFFGLVRSWHNSRSTEAGGPWQKLTVVISYATEAHLFIQDLNQSPFNVGRRIDLEDFNLQQTIDLNGRYGGPLRSFAECETLHALIEGQPFLTRRALDALATGRADLGSLMEQASRDTGPFGDHLQRILVGVSRMPEVTEYVKAVLVGGASPNQDAYYRLLSAGYIKQNRAGQVVFRCELYRRYLQGHLQ
jgi:class 3 adenylate cyclase